VKNGGMQNAAPNFKRWKIRDQKMKDQLSEKRNGGKNVNTIL